MRLSWTRRALRDLDALQSFIAQDSPTAARAQALLILAAAERLARFPGSGRIGRVAGTRELVVPRTPFILAYRQRGDALELLAILHGRQLWPERF
jgi:addiction module RelE/StbE family toxin